jgi:hypothetical protein
MAKATYAAVIREWEKLMTTVAANKEELPFLDEGRGQIAKIVEDLKAATDRQSTFRAQFQQATRDVEELLVTGKDLATRLRNGVRMQYGLKGEKLVEFGLQPRRKPQKTKPEPVAPQPIPAQKDS